MKNNKKNTFFFLSLILFSFSLSIFVFSPVSLQNIVQAISDNYNKVSGDTITADDWNNLDDDFGGSSLDFYYKKYEGEVSSCGGAEGTNYNFTLECDNDNDLMFSYFCDQNGINDIITYHDAVIGDTAKDGVRCSWWNQISSCYKKVWIICLRDGRNLYGNWGG